jgi:hypothetical protein
MQQLSHKNVPHRKQVASAPTSGCVAHCAVESEAPVNIASTCYRVRPKHTAENFSRLGVGLSSVVLRSLPTIALAVLSLTGSHCATLGAQLLPEVQASYNDRLALTQDTQFLLNIVRLRYRDTPTFLDVASLTTQQTMAGSVSLGLDLPLTPPAVTSRTSAVGTLSVTPTTTFSPVRGDDYVRRLVAPVTLQTMTMLASSGWSLARVLLLTVDQLNSVWNAPQAAGPTPAKAPDSSQFRTVNQAMRELQLEHNIALGVMREDGVGEGGVLFFDLDQDTETSLLVRRALSLPEGLPRVRLTEDFTAREPGLLRLRMRSVLGAMFYLCQGVDVPTEHERQGLVTTTTDADGRRFDWQQVLDGAFRVRTSSDEPKAAAVKVKHRGHWFYVADNDLESKSTFMLLTQLFNMQAGRGALPVPLLTIPAGR